MTEKKLDKKQVAFLIISGALSGAINGFFGGGGGMVIVPLLVCACGFLRKNAHATAICVMLPVCVVSAVVYIVNGSFDYKVALPVTIGCTTGCALGAFLLNKLDEKWLKYLFSVIIFAAGIKLLFFT